MAKTRGMRLLMLWTARVFPHVRFDDGCPATYRRIFPK
jgi:hypothetical protein